jgi:hypothetical protein
MINSICRRSAVVMLTLCALAVAACGSTNRKSLEALEQEYGSPATKDEIIQLVSGKTVLIQRRGRTIGGTYWSNDGKLRGVQKFPSGRLNSIWYGNWAIDEATDPPLLVRDIALYKFRTWPECGGFVKCTVFLLPKSTYLYRTVWDPKFIAVGIVFISSDGTGYIKDINGGIVESMRPYDGDLIEDQFNYAERSFFGGEPPLFSGPCLARGGCAVLSLPPTGRQ